MELLEILDRKKINHHKQSNTKQRNDRDWDIELHYIQCTRNGMEEVIRGLFYMCRSSQSLTSGMTFWIESESDRKESTQRKQMQLNILLFELLQKKCFY